MTPALRWRSGLSAARPSWGDLPEVTPADDGTRHGGMTGGCPALPSDGAIGAIGAESS